MAFTLWLTGLPGSGKSTLAAALGRELEKKALLVEQLDSDNLPRQAVQGLLPNAAGRELRVRSMALACHCLNKHGIIAVTAAVTPRTSVREELRKFLPGFVEVYVKCSLETAMSRDPKGLYKAAAQGLIPDFTGISSEYQIPVQPEVVVDTEKMTVQAGVEAVCLYLRQSGLIQGARLMNILSGEQQ